MGNLQGKNMNTYVLHDPNKQDDIAKAIIQACMNKNIEELFKAISSEQDKET